MEKEKKLQLKEINGSKVEKNEQDASIQITDPAVVSLQQEMDQIKQLCQKGETTVDTAIKEYIQKLQERDNEKNNLKNVSVKLAVTGVSGVGKSSFINAIRNVKAGDPEFALSSSYGNTTKEPTKYTFPQNEMIKIYDLPGYGTSECPTKEYDKRMNLATFDYIFLFVDNIFENDIEIAKKLQGLGKPFCIVRSKIDEIFKRSKQDGKEEDDIIENLKYSAMTILTKEKIRDVQWFAISSHDKRIGHFDHLVSHMVERLPAVKCESFILSLAGTLTDEIIDKKYNYLKARICTTSLMSAGAAAIPISVLDVALNIGIIVLEVEEYKRTFGFGEDIVIKVAENQQIKKNLHKDSLLNKQKDINMDDFIKMNMASLKRVTSESDVKPFTSIIGTVISSCAAYIYTHKFLNRLLEQCRDDAKVIFSRIAELSSLDQ